MRETPYHGTALFFIAEAGERNDIVVAQASDGELTLHDAGAVVTAGSGCAAIDAHAVRCVRQPLLLTALIDAGDGDDTVRTRWS